MIVLSAGLAFGTGYINDYYIGIPKDARPYDDYALLPKQDGDTAAKKPDLLVQIGSVSLDCGICPVYGFVGRSGAIELYTDLQKNSFVYSEKRDLTIPTGSETGFAWLGETSYIDKLPDAAALTAAMCEENYRPASTEMIPGTPAPADIYASDADVTYEVMLRGAEQAVQNAAADAKADQAAHQIELLENGAVKLTEAGAVSFWRYAFLTGATKGAFFPASEDGQIVPGALPTDRLYIRCTLAGTDTELETEPQTQEAREAKDALIVEHRAAREEAERIAREEAERKAREEAERKAAEEAAKKKAAEEAAKKKAEQAAGQQSSGKTSAEIAKLVEENRGAWTAELKKQTYYIQKNLERYLTYKAKNSSKSWAAVVQAVNTDIDRAFYTGVVATDMSKGYLILVNKYHNLKSSYVPKNLVSLSGYGSGQMEKTAAAAFKKMVDAAKAEGIILWSVSPYRSYSIQQSTYNGWVAKSGKAKADTFSARPGYSEHQTGLAVDINCASQKANFQNTKEYAWLVKNCYKYGFILRYPKGKEYITGYVYEPWHYRYLGVEHATKVHNLGITYEEYYAYYINK